MSVRIITILSSTFLISYNLKAENYYLYMGAGGESKESATTIFDVNLNHFKPYYSRINQKNVDIVYNGGHTKTEASLKTIFPNKEVKDFNQTNYNSKIQQYVALINSGKMKAGDQLIVSVDTHGAPNTWKADLTHQVATGTAHDGSENVSMDTMKVLVDAANKKGVKLAILDLSCHSGNTQKLANDKTCVISSTGPEHYSFKGNDTFTAQLFDQFRPGTNLEEAFIRARELAEDRSYPMISSPAGKYIVNKVYPAISPYLYFKKDSGKGSDNLDDYLFSKNSADQLCKNSKSLDQLISLINQIEKNEKISVALFDYEVVFKDVNFNRLKSLLLSSRKQYNSLMIEFNQYKSKLQKKIKVDYKDGNGKIASQEYSIEQILMNDYRSKLNLEKASAKPNKLLINLYSALYEKQEELKKTRKDLVPIQKKIVEIGEKAKNSFTNSYRIAKDEKKLYSYLYGNLGKNHTGPNPCKDIRL